MAVLDAQNTTFYFNSVKVGGIKSFETFNGQAADINISTFDSTAHEFRQGLQDFGTLTLDLMRDPSDVGQIEIKNALSNQATVPCTLNLDNGTIYTFYAYAKQISLAGAVDDVIKGSAILKITGEPIES